MYVYSIVFYIFTQTSAHLEFQEALSLFNENKWQQRHTSFLDTSSVRRNSRCFFF